MINKHLPNVVFYFDQTKVIAEVSKIENGKIKLAYNKRNSKIRREFYLDIKNNKKMNSLEVGQKVDILYSNKIESKMCIIGYTPKPNIIPLYIIIIATLPIIFFSKLEKRFNKKR